MKRSLNYIVLSVLALSSVSTFAQKAERREKDPEFMQKARAEKSAYIASSLNLTSGEMQKFLTVFNEIETEKQECFAARHKTYKALRKAVEGGDESAITEALTAYREASARLDAVGRDGDEKLARVLTPVQLAKYFIADEDFRRAKIHKLHDKPEVCPPCEGDGPKPGRNPKMEHNGKRPR